MAKKKVNPLKKRFIAKIEKEFGKGLVVFAEDDCGKIGRMRTGIAPLDWATKGGIPLGKVTILRGPEGGTKTTLAILMCARYLQVFNHHLAVYIDAEEKCPAQFIKKLKMDGSRFITSTPETMEGTIDLIEHFIRCPEVGILVLDSIAAMVPRIEIDASAQDQQQGIAARHVNKMVRKIVGALKMARVERGWAPTVLLVNQERMRIGVRFGDPMTLPGGEGQKYAASLILRLRPLPAKKDETERKVQENDPVVRVGFTVIKHSFGPKGLSGEYLLALDDWSNLEAGQAADEEFVRSLATKMGLIRRNADGGWLLLNREDAMGMDEIYQELAGRLPIYQELKAALFDSLEP